MGTALSLQCRNVSATTLLREIMRKKAVKRKCCRGRAVWQQRIIRGSVAVSFSRHHQALAGDFSKKKNVASLHEISSSKTTILFWSLNRRIIDIDSMNRFSHLLTHPLLLISHTHLEVCGIDVIPF